MKGLRTVTIRSSRCLRDHGTTTVVTSLSGRGSVSAPEILTGKTSPEAAPRARKGLRRSSVRPRIQSLKRAGSVPASLATARVLSFDDELRRARSDAQRELRVPGHRPTRAAVTAFLAARFATAAGPHGSGYAATRTAHGVKWHFVCPKCRHARERLYQPLGWTTWACRWCSGIGRVRRDR